MIVRKVGPLSFAKISGLLYGLMGLIFGGFISLFAIVGAAFVPEGGDGGVMGMLFGAAAVVLLPLFYGAFGFVMTLIAAWLYNVVAGWVGGVELDVQ
jgi:hypothetical protein